jgi:hypothetical protein
MSYQEAAASQTDSTTTSALRLARKVVVAVIGASVLAIGIALIVLPGPQSSSFRSASRFSGLSSSGRVDFYAA